MTTTPLLVAELDRLVADAEARAAQACVRASTSAGGTQAAIGREVALDDLARLAAVRSAVVSVRREERTYRPDGEWSLLTDAALAKSDAEARGRLARHAAEMRDVSTGTFAGLVPPTFALDAVQAAARPLRVVSDALRPLPLADDGMTVSLPVFTTAATASSQASQNTAPTESDPAITDATAPVVTIHAATDVPLQMADRGQAARDILALVELVGAVAAELERQVVNGSGTSGELTGLLQIAGIGTVTYTSATPTAAELVPKLGALATTSAAARRRRPDFFAMHSRRLDYLLSRAENVVAHAVRDPQLGDPAGTVVRLLGVPTLTTDAIPTTVSSDQDRIVAAHANDVALMLGRINISLHPVPGPATWRLSATQYAAMPLRLASGIARMSGTGLAAVAS